MTCHVLPPAEFVKLRLTEQLLQFTSMHGVPAAQRLRALLTGFFLALRIGTRRRLLPSPPVD